MSLSAEIAVLDSNRGARWNAPVQKTYLMLL